MLRRVIQPTRFHVAVGGYTGPSYDVELHDGLLRYTRSDYGFQTVEQTELDVGDHSWERFRDLLDQLDAWSWLRDYHPHESIVDGTSWSLRIRWGRRHLTADGSNGYPPGWERFCRGLSAILLRGRPFA